MQQLTQEGRQAVVDMAGRYQLSPEAVEHMLVSVNNGAGTMAQFNCPELGGSGQWMRGGMTMVGDMFNHTLKSTVDRLCNDLSNLLANTQVFAVETSSGARHGQWWPDDLGSPVSSGSQNNTRYAVFADRLAVDAGGVVTVYDTAGHQIGGVSQQQGGNNSLTFSSQFGTISVDGLPVVSSGKQSEDQPDEESGRKTETAQTNFASSAAAPAPAPSSDRASAPADSKASASDILSLIEKLAQLHGAGVLSDEEFSAKKQELLGRL